MSWLSKLLGGGGSAPAAETVEHKGFRITPEPIRDGNQFRIAAQIEKEVGGEMRHHHLIRADMLNDPEEAKTASVNKAKQMIDQMGEGLFNA